MTYWDLVVDICDQLASLANDRWFYHDIMQAKAKNYRFFFCKIAGAISGTLFMLNPNRTIKFAIK